ncbi:MAG TPA: ATP-binding protein [Verrucomicrobiae bacterium]
MKSRRRSYGYALASVLLVLVVGWVGRTAWKELRQLHRSFASVQENSFRHAEHVEASVRELNETVLRWDLRRQPADRAAFQVESQALQQWIRAGRASVTMSSQERTLMEQIGAAFDDYVAQSTRLMEEQERPGATTSSQPMSERMRNLSANVLTLCEELQTAERAARTVFLKDSQQALGWVRQLLLVTFAMLVVLVGTAVVALYRGVIGPLRIELGESRAIAARHEKLASLGTLAAGVAHEIRNPLTAINVRVHGLKRSLQAGSSEHEDVTVIDEEIRRLDGIVRDFLDFARPAAPRLVPLAAEALFSRVQSLLAPQWNRTAIRLKVEPPPAVKVRADPHQLEQVLINLLRNAAESIEGEGDITLRARADTARLAGRATPAVILEVTDTGKGIPPEVQKRLFDPFFTTKESGTGLGLAIAASIVTKHGGMLQYRTQVGRGTTFSIVLPRVVQNDPG